MNVVQKFTEKIKEHWDVTTDIIGIRVHNPGPQNDITPCEVGEELPESFVWDDGEPTDEELPGTSVYALDLDTLKDFDQKRVQEQLQKALEIAANVYYFTHNDPIYLVIGDRIYDGQDSNEVVVKKPEIIAKTCREEICN